MRVRRCRDATLLFCYACLPAISPVARHHLAHFTAIFELLFAIFHRPTDRPADIFIAVSAAARFFIFIPTIAMLLILRYSYASSVSPMFERSMRQKRVQARRSRCARGAKEDMPRDA